MNLIVNKKKFSKADGFFFIVCIGLFIFLWNQRYPIIYDEFFIKEALTPLTMWPPFSSGIVSILMVKLLGFIHQPQPDDLLGYVKAFSGLLFMVGPYLALRTITDKEWARVGAVILLISSCFPFLWLSSELFGAGFLSLAFFCWIAKKPFALTGSFLGLFSFCKPDLILPGLALAILILVTEKRSQNRRHFFVSFFAMVLILNLPGVIQSGCHQHFNQERAADSFLQHFAALVALFQIAPHPDPWMNLEPYREALIPRAHTFIQAFIYYPNLYLKFALLSFYEGVKNILSTFNILLGFWLFPTFYKETQIAPMPFQKVFSFFVVSLIGLGPAVLCSYPVSRYFAKYYPLAILTIVAYCEAQPEASKAKKASWVFFSFCVIAQLAILIHRFGGMNRHTMFWMKD